MTAVLPWTTVDADVAALLGVISDQPRNAADRAAIVRAIVTEARANRGLVDPNKVRARLTGPSGGLAVNGRVVGATYAALVAAKVIEFHAWVISTDRVSKNAGRPVRMYRMVKMPSLRAAKAGRGKAAPRPVQADLFETFLGDE